MMIKRHVQDAMVSLLFGSINVLALWTAVALLTASPFLQRDLLVAAALLIPVSWFFTKRAWVGIGRPWLQQPLDFEHIAFSGLIWGAAAGFAVFNLLMLLFLKDAAASGESVENLLLGGALFYGFIGFLYGGIVIAAMIGAMLGFILLFLDAGVLWLVQQLRSCRPPALPGAR
jgi:hypothetical protein